MRRKAILDKVKSIHDLRLALLGSLGLSSDQTFVDLLHVLSQIAPGANSRSQD